MQSDVTQNVPKVQDALGYLQRVKSIYADREDVYRNFLDIMKDFKTQNINTEGVIERVCKLFVGHHELILGFNQFLPQGYHIDPGKEPVSEETEKTVIQPVSQGENRSVELTHAVNYVAKIKERLSDRPQLYEKFLQTLRSYQQKRTINEVYDRIRKLFHNQPDLLDEFNYFLPGQKTLADGTAQKSNLLTLNGVASRQNRRVKHRLKDRNIIPPRKKLKEMENTSRSNIISSTPPPKKPQKPRVRFPPDCDKCLDIIENLKNSLYRSHYYQFLKVMNLFSQRIITKSEFVDVIRNIIDNHMFYQFCDIIGLREAKKTNKQNHYTFVSSKEFSECEQISPSYRLLPKDLPQPPTSGRTEENQSVLNDLYLSKPSGTEDQTSKTTEETDDTTGTLKSEKDEENDLLIKDDQRYELDLLISNNTSAMNYFEKYIENNSPMKDNEPTNLNITSDKDKPETEIGISKIFSEIEYKPNISPLRINKFIHVRAITKLYGDHSFEVFHLLNKSPLQTIPIILKRMRQKDNEWRFIRKTLSITKQNTNNIESTETSNNTIQ